MRLYGASCLNSIGCPNVYKGGGGAFTWFAPTSPVCRVLGPLGRAPQDLDRGTTVRPAAGHRDAGGGGLPAVVAGYGGIAVACITHRVVPSGHVGSRRLTPRSPRKSGDL